MPCEENENTPCEENENTPCEANENTPYEDVPFTCDDESKPPEEVNELLSQTIQIDATFVTDVTVKAVEEAFGKTSKVAATFKALIRRIKKPGKWLIKIIKKIKQKELAKT